MDRSVRSRSSLARSTRSRVSHRPGASPIEAWKAREKWKALDPYTDGWYTNDVEDQSANTINRNYQGNYERLVQVKNQYDPTNLFRLNANVRPTV